jgi:6-pyruvoyltetrahydropterin/6-carboxytetrahydropterin synthase
MSKKFTSTKVVDGFSTCFRQWKATTTHCSFLHGYDVSFKVWFEGDLDDRNWVADFGLFSRSNTLIEGMTPKEWFKYMFDHTVIVAADDPEIEYFLIMHNKGLAQVRVLPAVGAEKFAEFLFHKLNNFILEETNDRVRVKKIEFREHDKNTAIYEE